MVVAVIVLVLGLREMVVGCGVVVAGVEIVVTVVVVVVVVVLVAVVLVAVVVGRRLVVENGRGVGNILNIFRIPP